MLKRLSSSGLDDKKSSESQSEREYEPITVPPKPSAIAASAAKKIKLRNLESNLGLA